MDALRHQQAGRNRRSVTIIVLFVAGLIALLFADVHWALILILSLFGLPTFVDVVFNPVAEFELDDDRVRWKNATQEAEIGFEKIKSVHFATRLNVAFRITLIMYDDAKVQIPQDVLPPRRDLETAFERHNIPIVKDRLRLI